MDPKERKEMLNMSSENRAEEQSSAGQSSAAPDRAAPDRLLSDAEVAKATGGDDIVVRIKCNICGYVYTGKPQDFRYGFPYHCGQQMVLWNN